MPDFDLDAALASEGTPAFVYIQDAEHAGVPVHLHYLMLGPDEKGRGAAIAQLNWTASGLYIRWFGSDTSWSKLVSLASLKAEVKQVAEEEPSADRVIHLWKRFDSGTKWSLDEWWAKTERGDIFDA